MLIFKMVVGYPAILATDLMVHEKTCSLEVQLPSFLQRLRRFAVPVLKVNCIMRYQVLKNDTKYTECHEWFKNLAWESKITRKTKSFVPLCQVERTQQTLIYMKKA